MVEQQTQSLTPKSNPYQPFSFDDFLWIQPYSKAGYEVRVIIIDMERVDLAPARIAYVIHKLSSKKFE